MRIKFLGGAQTVTGSKTLVSYRNQSFLIDCGLFQGPKEKRILNWEPFELAKELKGVVLTHAHLDHSGYLPRLVKDGFNKKIYASQGTFDLCEILLRDSGRLQEEDARFANESGYSSHKPALPLYDENDAIEALKFFVNKPRDEWFDLIPGLNARFLRSGHIIGSSFVQLSFEIPNAVQTLTFSGDLGNNRSQTLKGPVVISETDYLVLESTYGNRVQPKVNPEIELALIINKVMAREGVLVIPAFSVGRTQEILYLIKKLQEEKKIPHVPVFLDSPMAIDATEIYKNHPEDHSLVLNGNQITSAFCCDTYEAIRSTDDSMLLCMRDGPLIVVSAAGMLTGGRVLHHLKHRLPHQKNGVLFTGYQAEGTKGRLLQSGIGSLRIHHKEVDVDAEIFTIDNLSAHADSDDILQWLKNLKRPPKKIFLNHGEPDSSRALQYRIFQEMGFKVVIPEMGEEFILEER